MESNQFYKLDNPAWHALNETHHHWAYTIDGLNLYPQHICPFGGIDEAADVDQIPKEYIAAEQEFFIIGNQPKLSNNFILQKELVCLQMVTKQTPNIAFSKTIIPLTEEWIPSLHQLVNLVQPGYFKPQTHLMGTYWGMVENDQLIAVTGERMQLHHFTEISAVVTHPHYQRQGLAKQLVAHAVQQNLKQYKIPFLHVLDSNIGAIQLYEQLGFYTRRKISFWLIKRLA